MLPKPFLKAYNIIEIIVANATRLRTFIPGSVITLLILLSKGEFLGIQLNIEGIKISPLWGAVIFLILLNITMSEKILSMTTSEKILNNYYFYPIIFEKYIIVRQYRLNQNQIGLTAIEKNSVTAKITDHNSICIKHTKNRVENSRLKFKLLKYDFQLNSPKEKSTQFECKCVQQTDSELIFKIKFPPQNPNTVLEYELNIEYDQAQFAKKSELMSAFNSSEIHRDYCISGKIVRKPTKFIKITLIFPPNYKITPDVFVSNHDGEMDTLRNQLQSCLETITDYNNQIVVNLVVNNPLIGVLYGIKWFPPDYEY